VDVQDLHITPNNRAKLAAHRISNETGGDPIALVQWLVAEAPAREG
jgi:hypothetical protein